MYKIIFSSLISAFLMTTAHCQEKPANHQVNTISGTVISVDAVGGVLTIQADDQKQMAFIVPDKVSITQQTHPIGLMEIRKANPVTIQYYLSSPGKYTVVSIVDNAPVAS